MSLIRRLRNPAFRAGHRVLAAQWKTYSKIPSIVHHNYIYTIRNNSTYNFGNDNQSSNTILDTIPGIVPKIEVGPASIIVSYPSTSAEESVKSMQFLHVWLRDSCRCPQCIHSSSGQKLHSSAEIPLDIKPVSISPGKEHIRVFWPTKDRTNTHESIYPLSWLIKQSELDIESGLGSDSLFKPKTWDASEWNKKELDFNQLFTLEGKKEFLEQLAKYGLCFINKIPLDNASKNFDKLTNIMGPNRMTFYGRTWDVKSIKNAENIAYTNEFLGLHMDLMYYREPPAIQLLYCLKNEVKGGSSMFTDIYKAVEILKATYPEDYETLCKVNVTFQYNQNNHAMHFKRPTIEPSNIPGEPPKVYFSPPFMGPLEANSLDAAKFYRAYNRLNTIITDDANMIIKRLEPGTCVVFHNTRVLHAREAFDPTEGDRHLLGTYVDWDYFKESYRLALRGIN